LLRLPDVLVAILAADAAARLLAGLLGIAPTGALALGILRFPGLLAGWPSGESPGCPPLCGAFPCWPLRSLPVCGRAPGELRVAFKLESRFSIASSALVNRLELSPEALLGVAAVPVS